MKKIEVTLENTNGVLVDLTAEEIEFKNNEDLAYVAGAFDREIAELRRNRNILLAETDYLALSDNTMSEAMTTYRQALRDITNGLTTVADVEAVVFPNKP